MLFSNVFIWFQNMNLADLAAFLGAGTGIPALFLQIRQHFKNQPKILLSVPTHYHQQVLVTPDDKNYISQNNLPIGNSGYTFVYLQVTIQNPTQQPLTIHRPDFNQDEEVWEKDLGYVISDRHYTDPTDKMKGKMTYFYQEPLLKFPLRLEAFDSVTGSIIFLQLNGPRLTKYELTLLTPRKTYRHSFDLIDLDSAFQNPYETSE